MTWNTNRRNTLPNNWARTRLAIFNRDNHQCVDCGWKDPTDTTLECDHLADPNDHTPTNLATRCGKLSPNNCHGKKTAASANQARQQRPRLTRPPEPHPGMLPPA